MKDRNYSTVTCTDTIYTKVGHVDQEQNAHKLVEYVFHCSQMSRNLKLYTKPKKKLPLGLSAVSVLLEKTQNVK